MASETLHVDCCTDAAAHDTDAELADALSAVKHLADTDAVTLTLDEIERELRAGRPIGVRVEWPSGSGHFLAISGCDRATSMVHLEDPLYLASETSYDTLKRRYYGAYWTHSYWTR